MAAHPSTANHDKKADLTPKCWKGCKNWSECGRAPTFTMSMAPVYVHHYGTSNLQPKLHMHYSHAIANLNSADSVFIQPEPEHSHSPPNALHFTSAAMREFLSIIPI